MRFEVEAAALRDAAAFVARSVERRNTIPILSALKISASEGAVRVEGTNMNRAARADVAATVGAHGALCASAEAVTRFCKTTPKGATVSALVEKDNLTLTAGRSSVTLATMPAGDFPEIAKSPPETQEVDPAAFCAALNGANAAASTEETRYYLCGTYLMGNRAIATDGNRLLIFDLPNDYGAIVPRADVPEICRLLEKGGRFGATASAWAAEADGRQLFGRCVEGPYPDVDRIMPAADLAALVGRDDFLAGIEAASLGTDSGVKMSGTAGGGELRLAARVDGRGAPGTMLGETVVTVPAEVKQDFEGGFNAGYLRDVMNAMPDAEVAISAQSRAEVALFEPADGSAFLGRRAVVMGMRL